MDKHVSRGKARRTLRTLRSALRSRFWDERPFVLSHLLTARCNADCWTCLWKQPADSVREELSTHEIQALYEQAAGAGFSSLVMWGGEPMVRRDLGSLARTAHRLGLTTTLITNGWWLHDRGDEVLPFIHRLLVSIDGVGTAHDRARRLPGLFERLDRGIRRTRALYPDLPLMVIAVISRQNVDQLAKIAAYGQKNGAQVLFQAMNMSDYGFADRDEEVHHVALDPDAEREVARDITRLRRSGHPVRDSEAYLRRLGDGAFHYTCHYKKVALRVEPNGDVLDCTRDATALANVRALDLGAFVASATFRDFVARSTACNRCRDAGVIEASHMWEGRPAALWNAIATLG